jgi:5-methylcytosine-specific restriction endonuclease McrBC GTP-binding regulatory subunit McrB
MKNNQALEIPRKIWLIACGSDDAHHDAMWKEWRHHSHITVGCNSPPDLDLTKILPLDNIRDIVQDRQNKKRQASILHKFAYDLQPDHYVIIRQGQRRILGIGVLEGEISKPGGPWEPGDHYQQRRVNWLCVTPIELENPLTRGSTVIDTGWSYKANLGDGYDPNFLQGNSELYNRTFIESLLSKLDIQSCSHSESYEAIASKAIMKILSAPNCILYGPPGTGKTHALTALTLSILDPQITGCGSYAQSIVEGTNPVSVNSADYESWHTEVQKHLHAGRVEFTTFHQNYAYEDFVEGLKAKLEDKTVHYTIEPGILKRMAYRALYAWLTGVESGPQLSEDQLATVKDFLSGKSAPVPVPAFIPNYVLIIDEINRGNVARIFGELITLVEDSKRACRDITPGAQPVFATLPYTQERFILPPNLHIIGTMNTADRSLIGLDAALRRRFDFIECPPCPELLGNEVDGVQLSDFLTRLNARIEAKDTRDHCIGHAYFMAAATIEDIADVMRRKVIPQLQEYFHDRPQQLSELLTFSGGSFVDNRGQINRALLGQPDSYNSFGEA